MPEAQTHRGSCHCGKFSYEVTTDLSKILSCNCSICSRKGYLLTFVQADQFKLTAGSEGDLTVYQFNTRNVHHAFCPVCGIQSFSWGTGRDGNKMYSVNVRCLEDVDLKGLTITEVDGKSR